MRSRLVPGLQYAQSYYEDVLEAHVLHGVRWLDVGCGHQILPAWRRSVEKDLVGRAQLVVGVDIDLPSLEKHATIRKLAVATLKDLPFPAESFDLVSANMVAEHLEAPEQQFAEIARVLRPGGTFIFHTPNRNAYTTRVARMVPSPAKRLLARVVEGREGADVFPTFYRVNTESRIREVAALAGLDVENVHAVMNDAELAVVPPLAFLELLWLRRLTRPELAAHRPTFIGVLAKREVSG